MENQKNIRKAWLKPSIEILNIKKDTFAGSANGKENKPASIRKNA